MTPPCNSACERSLCEQNSGSRHGAKDLKGVLRKGGVVLLELSIEVLNRRGFDTGANREATEGAVLEYRLFHSACLSRACEFRTKII
jgi:hypothetical protein